MRKRRERICCWTLFDLLNDDIAGSIDKEELLQLLSDVLREDTNVSKHFQLSGVCFFVQLRCWFADCRDQS